MWANENKKKKDVKKRVIRKSSLHWKFSRAREETKSSQRSGKTRKFVMDEINSELFNFAGKCVPSD